MDRLSQRVAIVTGGLRGIGRAIVEAFVSEGAYVLAGDLDTDGSEIESAHPGRVIYRRLDIVSDEDWATGWAAATEAFGPVNILVNNAGTSRAGSIADTTEEDWQFVMNVNVFGTFLGTRRAVRSMAGGGTVINIASARGKRPGAATCAYSASKAAVLSLTESTALHCGESGLPITCNAICPGVVETPLMRQHLDKLNDEAGLETITRRQVINRLGSPPEIAHAAVFLGSTEAAFITGTALAVDGGFTIRDN